MTPSVDFFQFNLIYTTKKVVSLLCAWAAMMILVNSAIILLSDSETLLNQLENLDLAKQICQSNEYSRKYSPIGSRAMDFAFRVAYLIPDEQQRKWIVEKMNEMASPLRRERDTGVCADELERCFSYLLY